jgi:protein-disulfide isomerase
MFAVAVAGSMLMGATVAAAQVSREEFEGVKSELGLLKEAVKNQTEVLKQLLQRIGALREPQDRPFTGAVIGVEGATVYGKSDARVTIVEFSDYQCPFCARYSSETFPQIDRDYIRSGRVKYVFRDYPIDAIHPQSPKAHEAVHCAAEQGKHREMHEKVFSNQKAMSVADLVGHAQAIGLDQAAFDQCLNSGVHSAKVSSGIAEGQQLGVRGTPTFFVGLTEANSTKFKAAKRIVGAQPYSAFKTAIDELLSAPTP